MNGCPVCTIVPPHLLQHLVRAGAGADPALRALSDRALSTLTETERLRGRRDVLSALGHAGRVPAGTLRRAVHDAAHGESLPGKLVRSEGEPASADVAVNEAYDGAGATYGFYRDAYGRNSVDDRGERLVSTVHFGTEYDNAFWDGRQMVYGDGDGVIFNRFTIALDVIGHELTHGVTQYEADLAYDGQSGALNESFSDVFGVLVKQYALGQTAEQADWLVGAGLFTPDVKGRALRSMKDPGTAYDDPRLGRDPQPAHIRDYVDAPDDNGGVHVNSGIPNRAFYLAAAALGGPAWDRAGRIWYVTLRDRLKKTASFADAARLTADVAAELFGPQSREADAVRAAWRAVGL